MRRKRVESVTFPYELRTTARTKRLRVTIYPGGRVVVSHPAWATKRSVERFVATNATWIMAESKRMEKVVVPDKRLRGTRREYMAKKEQARAVVHERLTYFNKHYQFDFNRVAIKNMGSRWGSCSQKKNLNFHYKIIDLTPELRDYLVVHELCHLREFNHGQGFWDLVGETIPQYQTQRKQLRGSYC